MVLTIDPGMKGAIVLYYPTLEQANVVPLNMPKTMTDIIDLLKESVDVHKIAVIERVGRYMPGNSGPAAVKFARHCGHLEASLYALGYSVIEVQPKKWQSVFPGLSKDKMERKRQIKNEVKKRFPELKVTLTNADALGILIWYLDRGR